MYRDELEAALARIAELESQLAELRAQAIHEEPIRARIATLEAELARARSERTIVHVEESAPRADGASRRARFPSAGELAIDVRAADFRPRWSRSATVLAVAALLAVATCVLILGDRATRPATDEAAPRRPPDDTGALHDPEWPWRPLASGPVQAVFQGRVDAAAAELGICGAYGDADVAVVLLTDLGSLEVVVQPPHGGTPLGDCVRDVLEIELGPGIATSAVTVVAHVPASGFE